MKDYKKILEGVVNIINTAEKSDIGFANICTYIGENCPELKESEDERMIQYFKDLAPFDNADELYEKYCFSHKDAIAWLEKQGEHANFLSKIQAGDKVTRNEDGVLVNLYQLNRVAKKQGEQKSTYKVESNFSVGDWVVYCNDDVDLITGIEENGYCINNSGYIPFICASDIRLWTIQDAKDCDVLAWDDSKCIALFKNIYDEDSFNSYGFVGGCTGTFESRQSYHDIEGAHPATKEQRDLLFQKMHEAGYEWDADKKELIKIEHKPSWSEKNNEHVNSLLKRLDGLCRKEFTTTRFAINEDEDWLKSLKDKYTWKPSEEQMNTLEYYMHTLICNEHKEVLFGLYADLKKLREK